ncbi:hypothetical protein LCGC14_0862400 [marine sediment metagenome]|uniref:Uncharacterized protein n=1 Tax=marine sediment metagenome TaxID=412755 RepID=A0A0F9PSG4_9ZZZZ
MIYYFMIIVIAILTQLYINTMFENRKLKKYIKQMFQANKTNKPNDLHYGR